MAPELPADGWETARAPCLCTAGSSTVTDLAAEVGAVEVVAVSAGCHVAFAAAVAGAPAARVVLWEPPDFRA